MKLVLLFISVLVQVTLRAQTCQQFPADCPETGNIEATQDSMVCISNWIAPQEITMQNRLRKLITEMMEDIARKNNWQVYELIELSGGGIAIEGNTKLLPFAFRPPYQYTISFNFIVNQDSLKAWQNWYHNDLMQRSNDVVASYTSAGNNSSAINAQQRYTDSANYYGTVMTKYMTDHQDEYQKAILANDSKGIKKYEDGLKKIQDKVNEYINKANGKQAENLSTADSKSESMQEYRKRNTIAYRKASTLRVNFIFNDKITAMEESSTFTKPLNVPGASFAALFQNSDPDETTRASTFLTSPEFAFLLFGSWNTKPDQYKSYHASYSYNKAATDVTTLKKITSDKPQTISLGVEGAVANVNKFIQSLPTQKLNALIVSQ